LKKVIYIATYIKKSYNENNMNLFRKIMLVWLIIGFLFWTIYMITVKDVEKLIYYRFIYLYTIVLIIGPIIWFKRSKIKERLLNYNKFNNLTKFLLLGMSVVIFEEIIAGSVHHLTEPFNVVVLMQRVGQFCFLNLFTFTGFYFAWFFLIRKFKYSFQEVFFLAGFWGLYAEKIIFSSLVNPIYFVTIAPIFIFVYGIMITLPMLSVNFAGNKRLHPLLKYTLPYVVMFIFSIVPIAILYYLRIQFPGLFPPTEMIP
jgi:hypothetical protein